MSDGQQWWGSSLVDDVHRQMWGCLAMAAPQAVLAHLGCWALVGRFPKVEKVSVD